MLPDQQNQISPAAITAFCQELGETRMVLKETQVRLAASEQRHADLETHVAALLQENADLRGQIGGLMAQLAEFQRPKPAEPERRPGKEGSGG